MLFPTVLFISGEAVPVPVVVERQLSAWTDEQRETYFLRALVPEETQRYRILNLRERRPRIVALGSSTAMEFRRYHFGTYAETFYNVGGLANDLYELRDSADILANSGVEVAVVSLDSWWFNPAWEPGLRPGLVPILESLGPQQDLVAIQQTFGLVFWRFSSQPREIGGLLGQLLETSPSEVDYGLYGRRGDGFRGSDGSHRYAAFVRRLERGERYQDSANAVRRVHTGTRRFERAPRAAAERLELLTEFVARAQSLNIMIAAYLPPLSPDVLVAIQGSAVHRAFLADYRHRVADVLARHGIPLVDAVDPSAFGLSTDYMIDGFHGSEGFMAAILVSLLEDSRFQRALPELDRAVPLAYSARPAELSE